MRDPADAPIELDDVRLERIVRALDVEGVVAASLIGSQATGRAGPMSDLDLGVWLDPALSRREHRHRGGTLLDAIVEIVRSDAVDLVVLNDASPLLRHRAVRDGRRLVERDHVQRVRLEARAILDYLDTQPLRDELARGLRHRLEEGRFGR